MKPISEQSVNELLNAIAFYKEGLAQLEMAEIRRRLEAGEKDRERLDWLERSCDIGVIKLDPDLEGSSEIVWNAFTKRSLRDAIDEDQMNWKPL